MKTVKLIFLALFASLTAWAQNDADGITVCHTSATEKFALFASNKDFNSSHPEPIPYIHQSETGKMITIKTTDGQDANGYLLMAKKKTNNWVFVFQEWWGLNDHIKREAEQLYNDLGNVNVIALDMYDGKLATTPADAGKYMGEFKQDRGNIIVKGAIAYAGKNAKIATVGWCFGGGQSMQASLAAEKQAVACVIYYGMPEGDVNRLKNLSCANQLLSMHNGNVTHTIFPHQFKRIGKFIINLHRMNRLCHNGANGLFLFHGTGI